MKTVNATEFLNYVMSDVPGCPRDLVLREIMESVIELCEYSTIWRYEMESLSAIATVPAYEIEIPTGLRIVKPISVRFNGRTITAKTSEWMDENHLNWRANTGDHPCYYIMEDKETIRFDVIPKTTQTGAITSTLALKPNRGATTVPEFFHDDWLVQIANGAKAKLFAIPKKGWSDADEAKRLQGEFMRGKSKARREAEKGNSNADLRVSKRRIISRR